MGRQDDKTKGGFYVEGVSPMPFITDFPTIVEDAILFFSSVFSRQPQVKHFAEYLTGLMVAQRKNVSAINREFVDTTDQSCLNRFVNSDLWDPQDLNERRLEYLQAQPGCAYHRKGVIAIDNTLIDKTGKYIEDAGWFWDHAEQRHKIAQDYIISNYVCPSGKHYPLNFRRFTKENQCRPVIADGPEFKDHGALFRELIDFTVDNTIPGDFTFDCYFSSNESMDYINGLDRGYVGDLKTNRKIIWLGRETNISEVAKEILPEDRKSIEIGGETRWYFTKSVSMPKLNHRIRIVILWNNREDAAPAKCLGTNRLHWDILRILMTYRFRWTGTETFHRDGKQLLGMGECQLDRRAGHDRHMILVFLAYSLLMSQLNRPRSDGWSKGILKTIGEACRSVTVDIMSKFVDKIVKWVREDGHGESFIRYKLGMEPAYAE